MKKIFWVFIILFGVSLGFTIWLGIFDAITFWGMFIILVAYAADYAYIVFSHEKKEKSKVEKKDIDYCFNKANEVLSRMPGQTPMQWGKGLGRKSNVRRYYIEGKLVPFRSFYGLLAGKQLCVLILNLDNDALERYEANPSAEMIRDPFFEFTPVDNSMNQELFGSPYSHYSNRRRKGITINVGDDDRGFEPSPDYVESALAKQRKKTEDNNKDGN